MPFCRGMELAFVSCIILQFNITGAEDKMYQIRIEGGEERLVIGGLGSSSVTLKLGGLNKMKWFLAILFILLGSILLSLTNDNVSNLNNIVI